MTTDHVDVLIVGAGLSGVGAGVQLKQRCPNHSFLILEGRAQLGGTWDLFRYPGIRSDSDMHTMGYIFRPWRDTKAIADGPSILRYIQDTAAEHKLHPHIRYQHRVTHARWSTPDARWTVDVQLGDGTSAQYTCSVLYMCAGYYSYRGGYTPEFPGREQFTGPIIHPQKWPEDLDYTDKKVVVIGSGATAITLIPSMAKTAEHVTMLQRSPTYIFAWPERDAIANILKWILPAKWAYALTRTKNIVMQQYFYRFSKRHPEKAKAQLIQRVKKKLGPDYDVETHFTPRYNPWEQRLCLSPNGDLFDALNAGTASVVTDHIDRFTENGIALQSGQTLDADIIVTATGLNLVIFGDVSFSVDDEPVDFSKTWTYKGVASSGVPNMFACFGYINASWTLRADLTTTYMCRVLNHMTQIGAKQCTPILRPSDEGMPASRWIEGFSPGYIQRFADAFPKQSDRAPWLNPQNYKKDKQMLGKSPIEDGVLTFSQREPASPT